MKKTVFLTGAPGNMGLEGLKQLISDHRHNIVVLSQPIGSNRRIMKEYEGTPELKIVWGDLLNYGDVLACVQNADIVLHCAAFVSPAADYHPELAMKINYRSTVNIINAIKETKRDVKLVYIGTIAETGDRMPPIHWGRAGDPLKPSVHDYYAVSKIAAERAVIESGLKYWVSLRQTGILSEKMARINDGIIFHNCLDNVLEYVTVHDSGVLLKNVCEDLPEDFWRHIYNIGGGESCRVSGYGLLSAIFATFGLTGLEHAFDANWFAIRNFHGHYYLDSDKLESYLHFRSQGFKDYLDINLRQMGSIAGLSRLICKTPGGRRLVGGAVKRHFKKTVRTGHGPLNWIENDRLDFIEPFFISKEQWARIPAMKDFVPYYDYDKIINIDHGYDESKPEKSLDIKDMHKAAVFRGGKCLSANMADGGTGSKLTWQCAFGHTFDASPKLILEGGHWCPQCERESWNYHELAKRSEFFSQVWYPLHSVNEPSRVYPKKVNETMV